MKTCPFCAEEIMDAAIKCKHCGEFLAAPTQSSPTKPIASAVTNTKPELPWYFKTSILVVLFLSVGPLALPLVWFHPNITRLWKVLITLGTSLLTWILVEATFQALVVLQQYYDMLNQL